MNTNTPRPSAVTDEEYQQALTSWATAQKDCRRLEDELHVAEELERVAYKQLQELRAMIAKETLEIINGR